MLSAEKGVLPGSDYYMGKESINNLLHIQLAFFGHYHCVKGYEIDRQYYDCLLLASILDGEMHLNYDQNDYVARKGDFMLIDCRNPHLYRSGENLEFIWAHFYGALSFDIANELNSKYGYVITSSNADQINEKLFQLISHFRNKQNVPAITLSSMMYDVLCGLYEYEYTEEESKMNNTIYAAIEYMKYHLQEPITIDDVAAASHLSKHHFSRVFRDVTGHSPYEYLIRLRIDLAKHLLKTTNNSVRDVAYQVGYQSEMGLINAFTQRVGITPGVYRNSPF